MEKFSSLLLEINFAELPDTLPHQVRVNIVISGFVMDWFVRTLANFDPYLKDIEDVTSVAVPVLQCIFSKDNFGSTGKR